MSKTLMKQLYYQPPMECIPLVLEPFSNIYTEPVVVLDFQSLYPSVIIAYNMCFSTFLGVLNKKTNHSFFTGLGFDSSFCPSISGIKKAYQNGDYFIASNGAVFAGKQTREGLFSCMVKDILTTRYILNNEEHLQIIDQACGS